MSPAADVVRRVLVQQAVGVAVLAALTILRLSTDGGQRPAVATEVYVLAMAGVVLTWCAKPLLHALSPDHPQAGPAQRADLGQRPDRLVALEESLAWAARSAYVRDRRMRPTFRSVVAGRLQRAGIDLDQDPRVHAILGRTGAWLALSGDEALLEDSSAGLTEAQIDELIAVLSTLERRIEARPGQTGEQH